MDNNLLNSLSLSCKRQDELTDIAGQIIAFSKQIKVWLFVGDLGAGKTTLIKEISSSLGVADEVASPTFAIINEYDAAGVPLYHFDFYRINNEQEAIDIGVGEYFYSGNYCFIEWPQKVENILPEELLMINIESMGGEERIFKLTRYE